MWENRGVLEREKKESFLLVRPLLDHFAGFVWSTKIGCRDGLSEHTFRETDGLVMWLCLRFVRSPMPLSEARSRDAACGLRQVLSAINIRQKLMLSLRQPSPDSPTRASESASPKRISGRPYHSYRTVRTPPANHPVWRVTLCIIVLLPLFGSSSLLLLLSLSLLFFLCALLSRVSHPRPLETVLVFHAILLSSIFIPFLTGHLLIPLSPHTGV